MTTQETALLIGALVGLMGAVQAWLVGQSISHSNQLNGMLEHKITSGAQKAVDEHTTTDHGSEQQATDVKPQRFTPGRR